MIKKVIADPPETVRIENADKRRMIVETTGGRLGIVLCDNEGLWRMVFSDGRVSRDFNSFEGLHESATAEKLNIYQV